MVGGEQNDAQRWPMIKEFIEREAAIDHFCVEGEI